MILEGKAHGVLWLAPVKGFGFGFGRSTLSNKNKYFGMFFSVFSINSSDVCLNIQSKEKLNNKKS